MVKENGRIILWSTSASEQFRKAYERIKEDSPVNAEKVKSGIVKLIDALRENPEKHPPDKFKQSNTGNYRAFEKYSYRIAYKYTSEEIIILRFRHVRREPKRY